MKYVSNMLTFVNDQGNTLGNVRHTCTSIWLTTYQMAVLYNVDEESIKELLIPFIEIKEVCYNEPIKTYTVYRQEGKEITSTNLEYYELSIVLAIGIVLNSYTSLSFWIWANKKIVKHRSNGYNYFTKTLSFNNPKEYNEAVLLKLTNINTAIQLDTLTFYQLLNEFYAL